MLRQSEEGQAPRLPQEGGRTTPHGRASLERHRRLAGVRARRIRVPRGQHCAVALGKKDDASPFAQRAEEAEAAFRKTFFDEARGVFVDGAGARHASLHANAIALAFGLAPRGREGDVADFCVSRGMACSPYFAQYLLDGLFEAGRADAAIALMTASG